MLARWRADQRRTRQAHGEPAELFAKPDGDLLHPQTLSQAFDRIVARTDLPPITLHGLRHTHATLLLKAGVPLKVVSERLGHAHPAFTMATYQHVLPGMQADEVPADSTRALTGSGCRIQPRQDPRGT